MALVPINPNQLYDTEQAAALIDRSPWTLIRDRKMGRGIPWIKVGRSVRYSAADIAEFIDTNRVVPGKPRPGAPGTVKRAPAAVQRAESRWAAPHLRGRRPW